MWDERAMDGLDALSFEINPPADDEPNDPDDEQTGMSNLIDQLRQRDAAATPGPWRRAEGHDGAWGGWDVVTDEWMIALTPDDDDEQDPRPRANAELIAEARNALPVLLEAAAILRDFAAEDDRPPLDREGDCHFCVSHYDGTVESHLASCLWRRAVEWVSTQEDQTWP